MKNLYKGSAVIWVVLVVIGIVGYFFLNNSNNSSVIDNRQVVSPSETPSTVQAQIQYNSGTKPYSNNEYGYEFSYPSKYSLNQYTPGGVSVTVKPHGTLLMGVATEKNSKTPEQILSERKNDAEKSEMPTVNYAESTATTFAGKPALLVKTFRAGGSYEESYYVSYNGIFYEIRRDMSLMDITTEEKAEANKILSSFKFTK